jgi:hypothetical protein
MIVSDIIDAYCTECDDSTKHEVMGEEMATCRCLVCDHAQVLA